MSIVFQAILRRKIWLCKLFVTDREQIIGLSNASRRKRSWERYLFPIGIVTWTGSNNGFNSAKEVLFLSPAFSRLQRPAASRLTYPPYAAIKIEPLHPCGNSMNDPTIICPNCKTEIKLTESLAAPLLESTRQQYEQRIAEKDAEVAKREAAIRDKQAEITQAQSNIDEQVAERLKTERVAIAADEAKKAKLLFGADVEQKSQELAELKQVLKQRDDKLAEAQKAQAELLRKERELDDAKREIDLTVEKRIQESLATVRDKAKLEAEEGLKLKVAEKEEIIAGMQRTIEELKRKTEQGSQQLQGEVLETALEDLLRQHFPFDEINPVPKGIHGGDVTHTVRDVSGSVCGIILWGIETD